METSRGLINKMDGDEDSPFDNAITKFHTYEEYLNSYVTPLDLYYLEDEELARQLVELGYREGGKILKRDMFEELKAAAEAASVSRKSQQKTLASTGIELKDNFLIALAEREEANRSGEMTSVIFIRDHNSHGQEISGYIDYSHRLKTEDFKPYFNQTNRFLPCKSDLSFYNWNTQVSTSNSTPNYQVFTDDPNGLLFMNKRDRKFLNVDPEASPGDNSLRIPIRSDLYIHVVIFDHITKRE